MAKESRPVFNEDKPCNAAGDEAVEWRRRLFNYLPVAGAAGGSLLGGRGLASNAGPAHTRIARTRFVAAGRTELHKRNMTGLRQADAVRSLAAT